MSRIDSLRFLKYVLAAVEHGSMRRAAEACGVRESTVSRNIGAIEQYINIQIFERSQSGVRLTKAGERWLETARPHFHGLEEVLTQAARRDTETEILRIGLCAPVGQEFLLRLIDRFRKKHPDVDVLIRDGACGKQAAAVRRRHLDVSFMCSCCKTRSCSSESIWEEGLSILLPAAHRLANSEAVTWEDLAGEHLLVPMGAEGPQLDPCFLGRIVAGSNAPIAEQCHASQATALVKVQLGKGFMLAGSNFASGITISNAVWRPVTGPNSTCAVKAVWLQSNPKRAVLHLIAIAQGMTAEQRMQTQDCDSSIRCQRRRLRQEKS